MPPKPSSVDVQKKPVKKQSRSYLVSFLAFFILLPIATILLAIIVPIGYKLTTLAENQPFALITSTTLLHSPESKHTRYRGPEYAAHDRYFFQWWNYLVYDAETHDHWTLVYMATRFSSAINETYPNFASAGYVHKRRSEHISNGNDEIPLDSLLVTNQNQDLAYVKKDGSIPHRMIAIDDDTYQLISDLKPEDLQTPSQSKHGVRWNITFHRVHGMYSASDSEEGNIQHCSIQSSLWMYHARISGWIEENGVRKEFGTGAADDVNSKRYRGYGGSSWGCKLPEGNPGIHYPWSWIWQSIPGDSTLSPPRPDISLTVGTGRFQTNSSIVGDIYGGFLSLGVDEEVMTTYFGVFHHNTSWQLPMSATSSDGYFVAYNLTYSEWTKARDDYGQFEIPLTQTYDIETKQHKVYVTFKSTPEQYFRLPVGIEHWSKEMTPQQHKKHLAQTGERAFDIYSDFRAVGVKMYVRIWKKDAEEKNEDGTVKKKKKHQLGSTHGEGATEFVRGGWDRVIFDGEVETLNALEYAYHIDLEEDVYKVLSKIPKFD